MNHLAHFLLSGAEPELKVGALLGDYVKGPLPTDLPTRVVEGIRLHRLIDGYTDRHTITAAARARFGAHRRLSGIVLDMYFDHFLTRHWARFGSGSLNAYAGDILEVLDAHHHIMSVPARIFSERLREYGLLTRYHDLEFIDAALMRIGERLGLTAPMRLAIDCTADQIKDIERDFLAFFPELERFARKEREGSDTAAPESTQR